ncbi:MAG TPA: Fic family protein [Cyclobacteriaceae bacterium]|jgi:Fic family protein|nr:Fic family protein [Cyclobacteriaceae bacterium]
MKSSLENQFKIADILRNQLNSEYPLSAWSEDIKEDFINDCTFHSNKLEGLKYNYGDTINLLRRGIIKSDGPAKDISDLFNHRDLLKKIFDFYDQPLTVDSIKSLHRELMKDPIQHDIEDIDFKAGEFKTGYNYGTRKVGFREYSPPWDVQKQMEQLVHETKFALKMAAGQSESVLSAISNFHYVFLNDIHPFADGNGRVARLIMNMQLMENGFPPILIKADQKEQYIQSLIDSEKDPDRTTLTQLLTENLIDQMNERLTLHKSMGKSNSQNNDIGV